MRLLFVIVAVILMSSCAHRTKLVGALFPSEAEVTAAIKGRWTPNELARFCLPKRSQSEDPLQVPLVLGDCNWRGRLDVGKPGETYEVRWEAIVIGNKIEVFVIRAFRGEDCWILEWDGNPEYLPYVPGRIPRLIEESGRPNQALVPTPMSVTPAAGAPVAPATGAAHLSSEVIRR